MPTTKLWASSLTSFSHSLVLPSLPPSWCSGSSSKIEKVKVMFFPIDALDLQVRLEKWKWKWCSYFSQDCDCESECHVLTFPRTDSRSSTRKTAENNRNWSLFFAQACWLVLVRQSQVLLYKLCSWPAKSYMQKAASSTFVYETLP